MPGIRFQGAHRPTNPALTSLQPGQKAVRVQRPSEFTGYVADVVTITQITGHGGSGIPVVKTPLKDEVDQVHFKTADGQEETMLIGDFDYRHWKNVVTVRHPDTPNTGIFTPKQYREEIHPRLMDKVADKLSGLKAEYQDRTARLKKQRKALESVNQSLAQD